MHFEVLVNRGAGSVGPDRDALERSIIDAFEQAGAAAAVRFVDPAGLASAVVEAWTADQRPRAVVIAGGDGTINAAVPGALEADAVLAVLPLGTFNHFAKDLGLPDSLEEAAAALVAAGERRVDVAEVNGRHFVNNASIGVYPAMVAIRDRLRERHGWGKVRAVPVAIVRVARSFPVHRVDLHGPGYPRRHVRTPLVFVGNGVFGGTDGGAAARAELDDGVLGVAVARATSRWGLVRAMLRTLVSGVDEAPMVDTASVTELTISGRMRHQRVAVDGEVSWMQVPLRFLVHPEALRVLGPS